jgi:hypothetical protein
MKIFSILKIDDEYSVIHYPLGRLKQSPVSLQGCIELLSRHLAKRAKGAKHSNSQA